jgi:hypothetical protein
MCMIEGADETYRIYNGPRVVVSRKEHRCDECYRTIAKGERYWSSSGLGSDGWDQHYICTHCYVAASWLMTNCQGFLHGAINEDIQEHVEEYGDTDAGPGLARIAVGMRRKWHVKRGPRAGQLMPLPKLPERITESAFK